MAALLLFLLLTISMSTTSPIPSRYDGFTYNPSGASAGGCWKTSVVVDAFLDPLCPDSRDSWPALKQVVDQYAPHVSLIVHPFPLPYHINAFLACRALHIANKLNSSSPITLLELFFKYQEKYSNAPTQNVTRTHVIEDMAKLGAVAVGNSLLQDFLSGFEDSKSDIAARISFKYGCSRGVYGAPFFFVNGFLLPDAGEALDYNAWKNIIEPLLGKNQAHSTESM